MLVISELSPCPRGESNPDLRFRNLIFSYRGRFRCQIVAKKNVKNYAALPEDCLNSCTSGNKTWRIRVFGYERINRITRIKQHWALTQLDKPRKDCENSIQ